MIISLLILSADIGLLEKYWYLRKCSLIGADIETISKPEKNA